MKPSNASPSCLAIYLKSVELANTGAKINSTVHYIMSDSYKASDKIDSGALFPNNKKERDTQPDLTGKLNVGGKMFWISAWKNKAQSNGVDYLKLSINAMEEQSSKTGGDPFP